MDEQEVLRRENQGRRDAEEVAAQMRDFCVHAGEVKTNERSGRSGEDNFKASHKHARKRRDAERR